MQSSCLYWVLLLWYSLISSNGEEVVRASCYKERNLLHRRGILVAKLGKIPTSLGVVCS